MYEEVRIVGERGQITIPKAIRKINNIKHKDHIIVRIAGKKIFLEKQTKANIKDKEKLMAQAYKERAKVNLEICKEWKHVDKEVNDLLGDY